MKDYIRQIIRIFTNSSLDKTTREEVHQWLVSPEHAEEKEAALHELWIETEGRPSKNMRESLKAVYRKAGVTASQKRQRYYLKFTRYAAAATLLVLSVSATYFLTKAEYSEIAMVENYTRAGEMLYIDLPDGSKVQTNSGTLLLYPEKFTGNTRTVFLLGEANFKVKPNPEKPFIVRSNTLSVTALGTEFNVAAYSDKNKIVATLLEGKVRVVCGIEGEKYILHPGQQVSYLKNTGASYLTDANVEDVTAWQRGILVFRSVTVKDMMITLQRKYNITIQYNEARFNNDKYNFRFSEKATIQEVFAVMKEVIGGFEYTVENDVYTVQ